MNCLSFVSILLWCSAQVAARNELKVSVYYESFCTDSFYFLVQHFCPTYEKVGSSLNVHLVPYGRATHKLKDGEWQFKCQHGEKECWGNKVQACGISMNKGQDANVNFVCCMMSNYRQSATTSHLEDCVHHLNTSTDSIFACTNSSQGTDLLLLYGDETHSLGHLKVIPTIILNDIFENSVEIQKSIYRNFQNTVLTELNSTSEDTSSTSNIYSCLPLILLQLTLITTQILMQ